MKNITVTMDDTVAEWVRVEAAKRGSSVSRLLGEWLAEKMRQEDAYAQAMREALGFESWGASSGPYVPRDTLFFALNGAERMSTVPIFVDTEILLASVDDRDAERQARAREWISFCWQTRSGRISSQVLNELYNQAIQRFDGPHVLQQVRAQVRRLRVWLPPHLDSYTVDGAWDLQDRYRLGYWDALILSSAHQQGCRYLLTEALPHNEPLDAVRPINPFLTTPNELDTTE